MLLHTLGVPRADVGVICEQPLPWRAAEVHVFFFEGARAITCRVSRCPGDLVRLEHDLLDVAPGTPAEICWTQDGRGSFATGTVVTGPLGSPGVHLRVDRSVLGVERRFEPRVPVRTRARLITSDGRVSAVSTLDLSAGGAHVVAQPPAPLRFTNGEPLTIELSLPGGTVRVRSLVAGVDQESATVRLRFVDAGGPAADRLEEFLRGSRPGTVE